MKQTKYRVELIQAKNGTEFKLGLSDEIVELEKSDRIDDNGKIVPTLNIWILRCDGEEESGMSG